MQILEQLGEFITGVSYSYLLIFAAEFGDKSQLVCMALAAKYRALPVMLGATLAFILLNLLAVLFGSTISNWIPEVAVSSIVALLFFAFGYHALTSNDDGSQENIDVNRKGHSILLSTFLLITLAEFGDKTQLAVVALSSTHIPLAILIGSSLALITTSALGIWAGKRLLKMISITLLHRISGAIFILLAILAAYQTYRLIIE